MFTHDAEYFRQRRRAQGIPASDPFSAARFQQRATELERLEQLPWPRNLFGELASIAELMAESTQPSAQAGERRWRMLVQRIPLGRLSRNGEGHEEDVSHRRLRQ
jgi:hypothetical protein